MDASILRDKESELFERWRGRRSPFIADGLVDPERYARSNPKIVFALKEVNDPDAKEDSYLRFGENQLAIDYWHPQTRWPNNLIFYGLIDAVRELRAAPTK